MSSDTYPQLLWITLWALGILGGVEGGFIRGLTHCLIYRQRFKPLIYRRNFDELNRLGTNINVST